MHVVGQEEIALVRLWRMFAGGGMGLGPLPFAGGAADQPAIVLASFDIIGAAMAALKPGRKEEE